MTIRIQESKPFFLKSGGGSQAYLSFPSVEEGSSPYVLNFDKFKKKDYIHQNKSFHNGATRSSSSLVSLMDHRHQVYGFNARSHSIDGTKLARMQNEGEVYTADPYYSQREVMHVNDEASVSRLSDAESRQPQIR